MKKVILAGLWFGCTAVACAQALTGLCMVSESQHVGRPAQTQVMLASTNCNKDGKEGRGFNNCVDMDNSNIDWSRWTGIAPEMLQKEGTVLTARMNAEPGELTCNGVVHDGVLSGRYQFTPSEAFRTQMAGLGFAEITPRKQLGFLMLDVSTAWVKQLKDAGVTELTTNKLMGLRALHVDPEYIRAMAGAGYPELRAGKLTEMKAVGVTPEKAQEAKALGFAPTEQQLVQMSIFHVDRAFVERMRARGLNDLTLDKLIKIRMFKVDE